MTQLSCPLSHIPLKPPKPSQLHIQTTKLNQKKEFKKKPTNLTGKQAPPPPLTRLLMTAPQQWPYPNHLLPQGVTPGRGLFPMKLAARTRVGTKGWSQPERPPRAAAMLGFGAAHRPQGGKVGGGCVLWKKMLGCGFRREVEMCRWSGINTDPVDAVSLPQDVHGSGHGPSRFSIHCFGSAISPNVTSSSPKPASVFALPRRRRRSQGCWKGGWERPPASHFPTAWTSPSMATDTGFKMLGRFLRTSCQF